MDAPLVFLHGFMGRPAMWDAVALEGTRETLPGHGPAPWFPEESGFDAAVTAMAERLPSRCVVVGYSLGGRVALALACSRPGSIRAVVVAGHPGLTDTDARRQRRKWEAEQAHAIETLALDAYVRRWEALPLWESQRSLPGEGLEAQRAQRLQHTRSGLAWAMRNLGLGQMPAFSPAELRPCCSFITGSLDVKFSELAAATGCPHSVIDGVGHNVVLEAPARLNALLRAQLKP